MTLVPCPACGADIEAASPVCPRCGRSRSLSARVEATATTPRVDASALDDGLIVPPMPDEYDFFPVSPTKFIVLTLCTFGIYKLYWSYKNWERIQQRTREQLSPVLRAFFTPVWIFSLFGRMRNDLARASVPVRWTAKELGVMYLVIAVSWRLPGAWSLVALTSFLTFLPVVQSVHALNSRSETSEGRNDSYSGANILTILFGGLFLVLAVIGSFVDKPVQ